MNIFHNGHIAKNAKFAKLMIFHCELVKTTKFAKLTINYYFFLISLQKTEDVPSGKEQGATAVFARYFVMA